MERLMDKRSVTLNDIYEGAKNVTVNPFVRSAMLGAGTYFGSRWLYDTLADKAARSSFDGIADPYERQMAWNDYQRRKDRVRPWLAGGATAMAMSLPFLGKGQAIKESLKNFSLGDPASWHNPLEVGMHDNPYPHFTALEKTSVLGGMVGDMALGRDFVLPMVNYLGRMDENIIPKRQSVDLLHTQYPVLGLNNTLLLGGALQNSGDGRSGLISTRDIIKGLMGAGFGAAAGWAAGNVMGTIFSQPADVKARMGHYGAIGGAILNSIPFLQSKF